MVSRWSVINLSGILVAASINLIERKGLDDAVGGVSVHGICGAGGVLAVSIFDTSEVLFMEELH